MEKTIEEQFLLVAKHCLMGFVTFNKKWTRYWIFLVNFLKVSKHPFFIIIPEGAPKRMPANNTRTLFYILLINFRQGFPFTRLNKVSIKRLKGHFRFTINALLVRCLIEIFSLNESAIMEFVPDLTT